MINNGGRKSMAHNEGQDNSVWVGPSETGTKLSRFQGQNLLLCLSV